MYDLIIIGGGPAGISASIYGVSRGLKTLLLEKNKVGGMIGKISMVTHYTGINPDETGDSFAERIKNQAEAAGVEILFEEVIETSLKEDTKVVKTKENTYKSKTVIIASGTTPKKLGIPGEEDFFQKGMGQNAKRDFENYKDKIVAVIGGSDGACKEALFLSKVAKKVYLIHHGEKLGAIPEFTSQIENKDNMEVLLNSSLVEVKGEEKLNTLVVKNSKEDSTFEISEDGIGVFVHIGADPAIDFFNDLELDKGYVKVDEKCQTNLPGVYAVGDVRNTQVRQVSTAVADGTIAAINLTEYIKGL